MKIIKKIIVFLVVFLISSSVGCGDTSPDDGDISENTSSNTSSTKTESQAPACEHDFEVTVIAEPLPLKDGEQKKVCKICNKTATELIPATKTL